jgi:Protein of unknown function (DUF3093)
MPAEAVRPRFAERLRPSPGIWAVAVGLGMAFGLILGPVNAIAALIFGAMAVVMLITLLVITTPQLVVTDDTFRAGRARLPLSVVSGAEALDADDMRKARGVDADARAFLCIRGWLPVGVRVRLHDPEDPTPYWLVSSRRPEALATAIRAGITRPGSHDRS